MKIKERLARWFMEYDLVKYDYELIRKAMLFNSVLSFAFYLLTIFFWFSENLYDAVTALILAVLFDSQARSWRIAEIRKKLEEEYYELEN